MVGGLITFLLKICRLQSTILVAASTFIMMGSRGTSVRLCMVSFQHHSSYFRNPNLCCVCTQAVLIYMNGIGGTYFPFANLGNSIHDVDAADEASAVDLATARVPGKDGILLVGTEGTEPYAQSPYPNSVLHISAGDAIAFYSYKPTGKKDWRSLHCSLTVPQEKWISTCWFRSEALTGPFSYLKKEAMLRE
jgi:hypothetical protein